MAFNAFVNFGDIKGECTDKNHKDWVMIHKYDHAVTQPPSVSQKTAGGRSAEAVILLSSASSNCSTLLHPSSMRHAAKGRTSQRSTIEVWYGPVATRSSTWRYKLKEVLISGVISNGDSNRGRAIPNRNRQV